MNNIFDEIESEVQSYARSFPVLFETSGGVYLYDDQGNQYLDFLAGAGTLNYGHNHPLLKEALLSYIEGNGIAHGLDMHTLAKQKFLEAMQTQIFEPRDLEYMVQFTGPTGTNAVEAALKLARNVTGRHNVISFTNGFHGVSLGAMAATGNAHHRGAAGIPLTGITTMPYDQYLGDELDSTALLKQMLDDTSSGVDTPAAIILETVQGEGGLNTASIAWLQEIDKICKEREILLIVDDIQAGCGRTGSFFSFEPAGIKPDIVTLSKSLSGFGLPLAVTLFKPELDQWKPGEHNGTFRGNNHAFITATKAIEEFWSDSEFSKHIQARSQQMKAGLTEIAKNVGRGLLQPKGRGMMQGLCCPDGETAGAISSACFERGMIIETSGSEDEVIKCLCPLIISESELAKGLEILNDAINDVITSQYKRAS
ncbi:MAG: diaminobutyrate--2-oxoglutarate transaminase [Pseudohongiella sp.]|nr:MAG: diaminobutyrate--2-oxoglutarate transaminase [Pseudohongiella sp.]